MIFYLPDLTEKGYIETSCKLKENQYYFVFRWNTYCDCAFMRVLDSDRKVIVDDVACSLGLVVHIDERVLPLLELKGPDFPPMRETFKDYYIEWDE